MNDLARLVIQGAANSGPSPLPPIEHGAAVEVDRVVSRGGTVCIGGKILLAAEILAGRQVGIRIEPDTLMFFDLQTRELLRVRPNPLSVTQVARLRGNRPAGPPPRPSLEPVRVQRRASNSGIVMVCGPKDCSRSTASVADRHHRRLRDHPRHRAARSRTQNRPTHNNHRRA